MTPILGLLLLYQAPLGAAAELRAIAVAELEAENLECAQVLLSLACWLAPNDELEQLEEVTLRELRASSTPVRRAFDPTPITDSPLHGLVARCPGSTRALRSANKESFTLLIDDEQFVIKGTSVRRRRKQPGEIEARRVVVVSDDETLVVDGRSLSVVERKAPGALAGRLLASEDAREREEIGRAHV